MRPTANQLCAIIRKAARGHVIANVDMSRPVKELDSVDGFRRFAPGDETTIRIVLARKPKK